MHSRARLLYYEKSDMLVVVHSIRRKKIRPFGSAHVAAVFVILVELKVRSKSAASVLLIAAVRFKRMQFHLRSTQFAFSIDRRVLRTTTRPVRLERGEFNLITWSGELHHRGHSYMPCSVCARWKSDPGQIE